MSQPYDMPKYAEVLAFCVNVTTEDDCENDMVHLGHLYKVKDIVSEDGFFPYGVRIADAYGNELTQTFHMLRFLYMYNHFN